MRSSLILHAMLWNRASFFNAKKGADIVNGFLPQRKFLTTNRKLIFIFNKIN
jgi:hypothetical protein